MRKPSFTRWVEDFGAYPWVRVLDFTTGRSTMGELVVCNRDWVHVDPVRGDSIHVTWPLRRFIVINSPDSVTLLADRDLLNLPRPVAYGAPRLRLVRYPTP